MSLQGAFPILYYQLHHCDVCIAIYGFGDYSNTAIIKGVPLGQIRTQQKLAVYVKFVELQDRPSD